MGITDPEIPLIYHQRNLTPQKTLLASSFQNHGLKRIEELAHLRAAQETQAALDKIGPQSITLKTKQDQVLRPKQYFKTVKQLI